MFAKKLRLFLAAVSTVLVMGDAAMAAPIASAPITTLSDSAGLSTTVVRMARGGGGRAVRAGGMHRGGAVAVRGGGYRRGGAVAVRGGGYRRGGAVAVRGGGYRRGGVVVTRGAWGNGYRWAPGGAIAAGAAIGFIAAGSAMAYASTRPPAPGLCWYYNDPSRRSGFWDVCP